MVDTEPFVALMALASGAALWRWWRGARGLRQAMACRERLSCPRSAADVECVLMRDPVTKKWTSVARCSAFRGAVTCDMQCLDFLNQGIPLRPSTPREPLARS
jgi:hypothetical protein